MYNPHPSLGVDLTGFAELGETVRLYVMAKTLTDRRKPYDYAERADETLEFGSAPSSKRKKNGKPASLSQDSSLARSLHAGELAYDVSELEQLEIAARTAFAGAQALAGESVRYCCGALRIASRIDYVCSCKENNFYKEVNECIGQSEEF